MTPEERQKHCYLGDGVYAEHTPTHLILRTGNHQDEFCDNKIYLEDSVLDALFIFIEHLKESKE